MHPFDEMKAFVGFTVVDEARLVDLWDRVGDRLHEVVDQFYVQVTATPRARAVFTDEAQIERHRQTLGVWLVELLRGPHDLAYYERRQRIGRAHVAVDLPSRFMFTAMSVVRRELQALARDAGFDAGTVDSIERVTTLDLAIMTGTYIEMHERAEMTTLQDLIVSNMPVTVVLLDHGGRISAATRPGSRLFGRADLVGQPWEHAFPGPLVAEARLGEHIARALASGRDVTLTRVDVTLDGSPRSFRFTIVPLNHALGTALIHVEELTEAVSTEARLRRAEALAQLGTFSAAVAHELRNPLAGMRAALQVIGGTLDATDPRRVAMGKVDGQIVRLNELITDLLQFARPPEARIGRLSLDAVARAVVETVRGEHPDMAIEVEGDGEAQGDEHLVHRILVNLIQNAVQATGGKGRVIVAVSPGRVVVSDDGPGVPEALREKVFEPFFTTRARGTGLGLAISSQAAGSMRGRVSLGVGPLRGAAFVVELPA